jgi:drug/metabolite transporter (DMT)-like permease
MISPRMASIGAVPQVARVEVMPSLAYAGLSLAAVGWATGFVAGKVALADLTPLTLGAWRYAVAAAILLPFALRQRPRSLAPVGRSLAVMLACGAVLYPWLFLSALARTTATNTSLLIALNPVLTLIFGAFVGESLERRRLGGVVLAFAGAATVTTRGDLGALATLGVQSGDLLALAAAATWACFNLAARGVATHLAPSFTNCIIYVAGAAALFALARTEAPWAQLTAATPAAVGGMLVMAVFSSVMAGQLFLVGVRMVGVGRTVVFVYLVPILTALLAAVLLGERFGLAEVIGGAAVLAGVYWTTRPLRP